MVLQTFVHGSKQVPHVSCKSTFVAGSLAPAGAGPGGGRPPHLHRLAAQDGAGEGEEWAGRLALRPDQSAGRRENQAATSADRDRVGLRDEIQIHFDANYSLYTYRVTGLVALSAEMKLKGMEMQLSMDPSRVMNMKGQEEISCNISIL